MSDSPLSLRIADRAELDAKVAKVPAGQGLVMYVGPPAHGQEVLRGTWLRRGKAIADYLTEQTGISHTFDADRKIVGPPDAI